MTGRRGNCASEGALKVLNADTAIRAAHKPTSTAEYAKDPRAIDDRSREADGPTSSPSSRIRESETSRLASVGLNVPIHGNGR